MAVEDIVRATIYIASGKLAELESSTLTSNTNGERMHGQDGVLGASVGNPEIEISGNFIRTKIPKAALAALEAAHHAQTAVGVLYKIGTTQYTVNCRITTLAYNSDSRTGTHKGTATMINVDNPTVV